MASGVGDGFLIESDSDEEGTNNFEMFVDMGEVQYEEEFYEEDDDEENEDDEGIETANEDSVHSSSNSCQLGVHEPAVGIGSASEPDVDMSEHSSCENRSETGSNDNAVSRKRKASNSNSSPSKSQRVLKPENEPPEMYSFAEEPIFDSSDEEHSYYAQYEANNARYDHMKLEYEDDNELFNQFEAVYSVDTDNSYDPFPGEEVEDCGDYVRKLSHHYCPYCNEVIDDKAKWMVHTTCYFLRRQVEAINSGDGLFSGDRWTFKCEISNCPTTCVSLVNLRTHMTFHFEKTLACKRCDHKSYNIEGMQIHIRTHTKDKPYKCSTCPKEYTQKLSLDMHIEKQHAVAKNIRCLDAGCSKMFSSERMMLEHRKQKQRWREKPKKFVCSIDTCGASFKTSQERMKHYAKRHPGYPVGDYIENCPTSQEPISDAKGRDAANQPKTKVDMKVDLVDGRLISVPNN
ncbi:Metal regulatory transcription factor 1 [Halotydeus destructor]|nr:Metal regulatory transcription factor 1 [Halotydeus destructor]